MHLICLQGSLSSFRSAPDVFPSHSAIPPAGDRPACSRLTSGEPVSVPIPWKACWSPRLVALASRGEIIGPGSQREQGASQPLPGVGKGQEGTFLPPRKRSSSARLCVRAEVVTPNNTGPFRNVTEHECTMTGCGECAEGKKQGEGARSYSGCRGGPGQTWPVGAASQADGSFGKRKGSRPLDGYSSTQCTRLGQLSRADVSAPPPSTPHSEQPTHLHAEALEMLLEKRHPRGHLKGVPKFLC